MQYRYKQIRSYSIKKAFAIVLLFIVIGAGFKIAEPIDQQETLEQVKSEYVYVTKVIDGDTFWVRDGSNEVKVRFIGIDAPETRNAGRKKKGYFGQEAKAYVTELTLHRRVRLELDVQEKDRYQRLLAYVYLEDGTFLNAHLVANGYAVLDTYPPNVKYVDLFADLQQQARREKRGLWAESIILHPNTTRSVSPYTA